MLGKKDAMSQHLNWGATVSSSGGKTTKIKILPKDIDKSSESQNLQSGCFIV